MLALLAHYGLFVAGVLILLESAGLPVPGETALVVVAAGAAQGLFPLWAVCGVAVLAAVAGASGSYWAGWRFGRALVKRYGRWLRITSAQVARAERFRERHGSRALFFGRFITSLRVLVSFLAGAAHVPYGHFLIYTAASSAGWTLLIGGLAYILGRNLALLESWLRQLGWGAVAIGGVVVLLVLFWRRRTQRQVTPAP
jgi:membrane protein DedA with SNARE-associated domain